MDLLLFQKILLALAIGAMIGLERERRLKNRAQNVAGVRTFMLVCLLGVLTPYVGQLVSSLLPVYIGLAAVAGMVLTSYYVNFKKFGSIGLTTAIAFFLAHVIGIMMFFEGPPYFISISLGVILTLILFSLEPLHNFAHKLTKKEVRDAVIFAVLAFVVLPLLPNKPVDPYGAINPYLIWLSMVVVMSVSFAGYVVMKLLSDERGLGLAGFFGGLVSSTSITVVMSEKAKRNKAVVKSAAFAIIVASSTMFLRMLFVASVFNYLLFPKLALALGILGATGYVLSYIMWKKSRQNGRGSTKIKFSSPISFKLVLQFMAIFIIVSFASNIVKFYFPSALYPLAIFSGLYDVDAITINLASLSDGIPLVTLISGILLAALSNTFSKMILSRWIGGKGIGNLIIKLFSVLLVVGIVVLSAHFLGVF